MDKEIGKTLVKWKADMDAEKNQQKQAVLLVMAINDIQTVFQKQTQKNCTSQQHGWSEVVIHSFILMGFEFNDLLKSPSLFSHENEHGILTTVDEWDKAETFDTIELAEYKRQYLQVNYNDYYWYVVRLN